jgi:hypothetical protein
VGGSEMFEYASMLCPAESDQDAQWVCAGCLACPRRLVPRGARGGVTNRGASHTVRLPRVGATDVQMGGEWLG